MDEVNEQMSLADEVSNAIAQPVGGQMFDDVRIRAPPPHRSRARTALPAAPRLLPACSRRPAGRSPPFPLLLLTPLSPCPHRTSSWRS